MAKVIYGKNGGKFVLLNPNEKGKRYARQLRSGRDGRGKPLSKEDRSYRAGYLDARRDNLKLFKSKNKRK